MAQAKEFAEVYPVPVDGLNFPGSIVATVSFETGEIGTYRIYTAGKIRINRVKGIVVKAIEGTNDGTITVKDAAGDTIVTLTATKADALGVEYDSSLITDADRDILADSYFDLVTAKSTAGGKVFISVEYSILPLR